MPEPESLYEKLKSMGMQLGNNHFKPAARPTQTAYSIETVVSGSDLTTAFGQAFYTREQYPSDYLHGRIRLCTQRRMDVLAAWSGSSRITQPDGQNIIFLDTETSGLSGGTGTYAFLIGIGYNTAEGFELVQLFMRDPGQEAALLAALDQWLARFDVVVTFNGKTFDIPLLNTRYIMNSLTSPFGQYEHVDVLQIARKLWRDRLPSRALGELEKVIVNFYRNEEEVPGWLIPQLYFDYLRTGDARPLGGVFYHNARDILSLAALYGHVAEMLNDPLTRASEYALDLASIARLYEEMGWIDQAALLYEQSLEMGNLPEPFYDKTIERFALLYRKKGDWEKAAELWKRAAEHGEITACIELAKYYEHHERNYSEALIWARKALVFLHSNRTFPGSYQILAREIEHRIGRLSQRAADA